VGIYAGAGTMIEAPHTGATVRQAPIWRSDLFAAGRPG
jgi:cell wall-associated NlpC family hydrolase